MQTQTHTTPATTETIDYYHMPEFQHGLELLEQQQYQEAYNIFVKLATQHPDNGYAHYELAFLCHMTERYGLALQAANLAIQHLQEDNVWLASAYVQRSNIYGALDDTEKQLQDLNESIRLMPDNGSMYANRGNYYACQRQYDLSNADYCKQAELEPGNAHPYAAMGGNAMMQGDYDEAERLFAYALKLDPNCYPAHSLMGDCMMSKADFAKAAECYIKALTICQGDERTERALLKLLPRGLDPQIIAQLERLSREHSNDAYWPYLMGQLYFYHDQCDDAIIQYEEAYRRCAAPTMLGNISHAYYKIQDYPNARYYASKATEMDPTDDNAQCVLAHSLMEMELFEEASQALQRYLDIKPDLVPAHQLLADAYRFLGNIPDALDEVNKAIGLAPDTPVNYYTRAKIEHDLEAFDAEIIDLEHTLELLPADSTEFSMLRCQTLQMLGCIDEAEKELAKTHNEDCFYYLCLAINRAKQGSEVEATEALKHALNRGMIRFKMLRQTPLMEPLRQLPQFEELVNNAEVHYHADLAQQAIDQPQKESCEVPITQDADGTISVRGEINGLPLKLVFDTGASDITISSVEAAFMLKNGYLEERDLGGVQNYKTASGDLVEGTIVNLRQVQLGTLTFYDLRAAIIKNQDAPLLLGQSILGRLMTYQVNNQKKTLYMDTPGPQFDPYDLDCLAFESQENHNYQKAAICYKWLFNTLQEASNGLYASYNYMLAGQLDKALSMLDATLEHCNQFPPDNAEETIILLKSLRATTLQYAHRFDEACEALAELEPVNSPEKSVYFYSHGWTLRRMERYADAEMMLMRAEELNPQGIGQKLELGNVFKATGREQEALAIWQQATQQTPEITEIPSQAEVHHMLGQDEQCLELLSKVTAMDLDDMDELEELRRAAIYTDAAYLYATLGDYDKGEACLRQSLNNTIAPFLSLIGLLEGDALQLLPNYDAIVAEYVPKDLLPTS